MLSSVRSRVSVRHTPQYTAKFVAAAALKAARAVDAYAVTVAAAKTCANLAETMLLDVQRSSPDVNELESRLGLDLAM
jgi:hypothetical protein